MILGKDSKETIDPIDSLAAGLLLDARVNIDSLLRGYQFGPDILRCLNEKISFGLSNGESSWIVFNVSKNYVYDYSYGSFSLCNAGTFHRMLNYLKVALISHREFRTSEMCVRFLQQQNLLT